MFEKPVLIYSDYCNYCNHFFTMLKKHPEIYEKFAFLNIDVNQSTRQRPRVFLQVQQALGQKITDVPTAIVNNGNHILPGKEAFKWLQYEIQQSGSKELAPFNPNEMGAFSDQYSKFGSTTLHDDASEQSFLFVNKEYEKIKTPQEDSMASQGDYNGKQNEREQFDNSTMQGMPQMRRTGYQSQMQQGVNENDFSNMMNQRQNVNVNAPRQDIDFTNPNFGYASQSGRQGGGSQKAKDFDKRLEDMLSQRQDVTPQFGGTPQHAVDFTTGTIHPAR
jgi:hypothetical protein